MDKELRKDSGTGDEIVYGFLEWMSTHGYMDDASTLAGTKAGITYGRYKAMLVLHQDGTVEVIIHTGDIMSKDYRSIISEFHLDKDDIEKAYGIVTSWHKRTKGTGEYGRFEEFLQAVRERRKFGNFDFK